MAATKLDYNTQGSYNAALTGITNVGTHVILEWNIARRRFVGIVTHD